MFAALDALKNFQRTVGGDFEFIHALELVGDAEAFADHLHRGARAARRGFPAAEHEQPGFVETGDGLDGVGERGSDFRGLGEPAGRAVERDEFKRHLLRDGHHHLLELGLGAEADKPDLAAGRVLDEIRGLVERVAGPRVEDGGQHHFIFQRGPARAGDRLQGLERVRDDAAADDNLVCNAHAGRMIISGELFEKLEDMPNAMLLGAADEVQGFGWPADCAKMII